MSKRPARDGAPKTAPLAIDGDDDRVGMPDIMATERLGLRRLA
jgi:hypothetical protein